MTLLEFQKKLSEHIQLQKNIMIIVMILNKLDNNFFYRDENEDNED